MALATSSLPVPFSPWISTLASVGATDLIRWKSCRILSLRATMFAKLVWSRSSSLSRLFSADS